MQKIHLDTDIGGDMDDLCALALLLKRPDLEITGVTTVSDDDGRRAGYVRYVLEIAGRTGIPVAAGADVSGGYYDHFEIGFPPDADNWPDPVPHRPGSPDKAIALLKRSIEQGATVIGIGPYTNFRLLGERYPGILRQADLWLMGGRIFDPPAGYPQWGNEVDYNIQVDAESAYYVLEQADPVLVPLAVSCQTALRRAHLPRLAQAGRLGQLIVRQAELFARMEHYDQIYGASCPALPEDLINFQHDPLACALASGWEDGVEIESVPLRLEKADGWLYEIPDDGGRPRRVVTAVDGGAFDEYWCAVLCGG